MNIEPVAWMDYLEHSDVYDLNVSGRGIPLYTHPAKTLTDEEIVKLMIPRMKQILEILFNEGWLDEYR
jgi:hypothetical protein